MSLKYISEDAYTFMHVCRSWWGPEEKNSLYKKFFFTTLRYHRDWNSIRNDSFELCIIHFFMYLLILQTFIEHEHLQGTVGYLKDAEDLVCHKIHRLVGSIGMLMKNYSWESRMCALRGYKHSGEEGSSRKEWGISRERASSEVLMLISMTAWCWSLA